MVECSEASELIFEKLLTKLVDYKKIEPSVADQAKSSLILWVIMWKKTGMSSEHFEKKLIDWWFSMTGFHP